MENLYTYMAWHRNKEHSWQSVKVFGSNCEFEKQTDKMLNAKPKTETSQKQNYIYWPVGTAVASRLKMPLTTMEPHASQRRPQRSSTSVRKVSAGISVADARVNVRNTFRPNEPTFRTWPSNTSEMAILEYARTRMPFKRII